MRKLVIWAVRIVALAVILISLGNLGVLGYHYYQARHEYTQLAQTYKQEIVETVETQETVTVEEKFQSPIRFEDMWHVNPDVVGWITFDEESAIDYPIMQGEDNDAYLHHTFYGKENASGSIFLDSQNSNDFQDYHTVIYGHNMRDLSMFGTLKKYQEEEYYRAHPYFTIYTPEATWRYEIFSCHRLNLKRTDVYTLFTRNSEKFGNFVDELKEASLFDTGVEVDRTDHIITLSTCTTGDTNRFVVHAKRIEE